MDQVRSSTARRVLTASGCWVSTIIPSRAGRWQEAGKPRWPSTWTRQVRQAPRGGRSGSLQSWGGGRRSRLTASRTVTPSGTSTGCPSMLSRMALRYPSGTRLAARTAEVGREVLEGGPQGERGSLAQPAEGRVLDDVGELEDAGEHPRALGGLRPARSARGLRRAWAGAAPVDAQPVDELEEANGSLATGRALPAGLLRVEGEERPDHVRDGDRRVEGHDTARPRGEGRPLERRVEGRRRDDDPRRSADQHGLEGAARPEAAPQPLDQPPQRHRRRHLDDARTGDVAGQAEELGPGRLGPPRDDQGDGAERLHVVDHGGLAEDPDLDGERGLGARHRATPFDRLEQRRLLAEDEAAGAAPDLHVEGDIGPEDTRPEDRGL